MTYVLVIKYFLLLQTFTQKNINRLVICRGVLCKQKIFVITLYVDTEYYFLPISKDMFQFNIKSNLINSDNWRGIMFSYLTPNLRYFLHWQKWICKSFVERQQISLSIVIQMPQIYCWLYANDVFSNQSQTVRRIISNPWNSRTANL